MTNQKEPMSEWQHRALEAERALEQMRMDRDGAASACERLREDNLQLEAQVERLRQALQRMVDEAAHLAGFSVNTETAVLNALDENRAQSLAEVRAEAVESAVGRCAWYADRVWMKIDDLKDYAQQIRENNP